MRRLAHALVVSVVLSGCAASVVEVVEVDRVTIAGSASGDPVARTPVVEVVASAAHVCARTRDGAVFCWGEGRLGQLGVPLDASERPIRIALPPVRSLAVGDHTTCAVARDDGALWCWGGSALGTTAASAGAATPGPRAMGLTDVTSVVLHRSSGCALTRSGAARCWNETGWLELDVDRPVRAIAIHDDDVYALTQDGGWVVPRGRGLADAPPFDAEGIAASAAGPWLIDRTGIVFEPRPERIGSTTRVTFAPRPELGVAVELAVLAGWTCTRTTSAELVCRAAASDTSQLRLGIPDLTRVAASSSRVCGSSDDGAVCVAPADREGFRVEWAPGRGIAVRPLADLGGPVARCGRGPLEAAVVEVAVGDDQACAALDDGTARCWGGGGVVRSFGLPPAPLDASHRVSAIASGGGEVCSIDERGTLRCMGPITSSGITDATVAMRTPREIAVPAPVREVALGDDHGCARTVSGAVWCWTIVPSGRRPHGDGGRPPRPQRAPIDAVTALDSGARRTCAVREGNVLCWQPAGPARTPQRVFREELHAVDVAVQDETACVLAQDGSVLCWGANDAGQLGRSGAASGPPVPVLGLPAAEAIVASRSGFCVLTRGERAVWCWGRLGRGEALSERPRRVDITPPVRSLAAGDEVACAVEEAAGGVCCWGSALSNAVGRRSSAATGYVAPAPIIW